jgi:hypothetical protein
MPSSSALSDALIGRLSWEDPEVFHERDILLGSDTNTSQNYIRNTRKKLVSNFKSSFIKMVDLEKHAFGVDSFFSGSTAS